MTEKRHELDKIQRWMQSVIMHPGGVEEGIASEESKSQIDISVENVESVIQRSRSLTSVERLNIYGNAYYTRLLDCLSQEFPALAHTIGEELLRSFAVGYLQEYPSTSYTLNELADNFPKYLDESRSETSEGEDGLWMQFVVDLAGLERLYSEVFDGPGWEGSETLAPQDIKKFAQEDWSRLILETVPCFRLAKFEFPVQLYASAVRNKEEPAIPNPEPTFLAVSRIQYRVRRWALSELQYDLLHALHTGELLEEAIEGVVQTHQPELDRFAADLRNWFADWTDASFFKSARFQSAK